MNYYMGIDMGGTMVKAALYDETGHEAGVSGEKLTVLYPRKDMNERSITDAGAATYRVIKDVIQKTAVNPGDIKGVGVTGQGNGLYLFDAEGNPVRNCILSSDSRARDYVARWQNDGTWKSILPRIRQQIWPGSTPMIMRWLKDNERASLDQARYAVTAKEYVRYLLTGDFMLEVTECSAIASMDQEKGRITEEVYGAYGLADYLHLFPEKILDCTEIGGTVSKECAGQTGLVEGTPVVGGAMDTGASTLSCGVTEENQLGIIVGSWGINSIVKHEPVTDENIFIVYKYCIPGMYCLLEGSPTSTTNQEWFIENFVKDSGETDVYAACTKMVEETPYRDAVMFLPFLYGSNVSVNAKAVFMGLSGGHGRAEMLRALYEGVVFCHQYHIDKLSPYIDHVDAVRMAGGAARSKVWMQMFSDILDKPVEISRTQELGAMGAAMLAAVGTGAFSDLRTIADKFVQIRDVYKPDPEKHAYYEKKYDIYKRTLNALAPLWRDLDMLGL